LTAASRMMSCRFLVPRVTSSSVIHP
jgi:hypothetical protein